MFYSVFQLPVISTSIVIGSISTNTYTYTYTHIFIYLHIHTYVGREGVTARVEVKLDVVTCSQSGEAVTFMQIRAQG